MFVRVFFTATWRSPSPIQTAPASPLEHPVSALQTLLAQAQRHCAQSQSFQLTQYAQMVPLPGGPPTPARQPRGQCCTKTKVLYQNAPSDNVLTHQRPKFPERGVPQCVLARACAHEDNAAHELPLSQP